MTNDLLIMGRMGQMGTVDQMGAVGKMGQMSSFMYNSIILKL